ncbi:putative nucleotidyltransferase substrate binding domain-containing protein [Colwellia hornerae]|uniref:Cyclic nucleotide-binding/CBS domain-containing protein n=1 Tax=Colwellia hornerae TaxID=89402 RepID=A0A5C6QD48_9GAMM|nr:putative nucleotidyltransferase substrate binding domain-containing protein [Colwellia hornerae]TWX58521.1 cyclic nucleotide-binding/CBS domain-containing protein [Colwellia hornerae]TWX58757.1 cyclic nucleotide-binding/CBS domain-containing protein [Colwellia hornerae]TWX66633.1 cyclic nucleotide-binding/CBS domain-containing protein [Colwellia hornerae]
MDHELAEISAFLQAIPPFDTLPESLTLQLVKEINICYVRAKQPLPPNGIKEARLYILRKGALVYTDHNGQLVGKYTEGEICSVFCRPAQRNEVQVNTEEDTLLYSLDYQTLLSLVTDYPQIDAFFMQTAAERLKGKMGKVNEDAIINSSLINNPISQFYHKPVLTINRQQSIQQAALKMTEKNISCLVVVDDKEKGVSTPVGIVTDKDIRRRCVAEGLSFTQPVSKIMTADMATLPEQSSAYDALMLMTSKRIHHLPITGFSDAGEYGELVAMVTITDLMNNEGHNAVNITSIIRKAATINDLIRISKLLPKLQIRMAKLGTSADHIGKSISAITMAFTIRIIEMSEKINGKAPVPYAWVACGSQARQEQLAHSDQDNALIISDEVQPEHEAWFENLASFVCDGLAACGFILCPGDIMASNPKWRQPQQVWHQYFEQWVSTPSPQALLNGSVFFDFATVHGDESLLNEVRSKLLAKTKGNSLFLAHLSRNALMLRPPLGFFRDFVLISDGEHKASLDIKHNGIAPIVDLARIYALAEGIASVNTIERLKKAAGSPSISKESAANLIDAYEFLGILRLEHQANLLQAGKAPNNYLSPKKLSKLEREHLKDAFKVIKALQDSRQSTY